MQEVTIDVNKQFGGYTFGISPRQKIAITNNFGGVPSPNLFISYDTKTGLKPHKFAIKEHIIPFMLGLNKEKLTGFIVKFIQPVTREEYLTLNMSED